jgi:hypothetical protein
VARIGFNVRDNVADILVAALPCGKKKGQVISYVDVDGEGECNKRGKSRLCSLSAMVRLRVVGGVGDASCSWWETTVGKQHVPCHTHKYLGRARTFAHPLALSRVGACPHFYPLFCQQDFFSRLFVAFFTNAWTWRLHGPSIT